MIVHDPDAAHPGSFTLWVLWNIEPGNTDVPESFKGAQQGFNDEKKTVYTGMCAPSGKHHCHFMVYSLDEMLQTNQHQWQNRA